MIKLGYVVLAVIVSAALSVPAWAQGRGAARGRGGAHAAPAAVQQTMPATSVAPTPASAAHRNQGHHGTAKKHVASKTMPARSNKGGAVRGQDRAQEVHGMNQQKQAAQKSKTSSHAPHRPATTHSNTHHGKKL